MNNKKKIILFLGAISLIAFGNYTRFLKNNNGKTVVEGKIVKKLHLQQEEQVRKEKVAKKQLHLLVEKLERK